MMTAECAAHGHVPRGTLVGTVDGRFWTKQVGLAAANFHLELGAEAIKDRVERVGEFRTEGACLHTTSKSTGARRVCGFGERGSP